MDGFETCRRLKQNPALKNTPIIFMTGLSDSDSIVRGFDAGSIDYLTKPINPQEPIARLNFGVTPRESEVFLWLDKGFGISLDIA